MQNDMNRDHAAFKLAVVQPPRDIPGAPANDTRPSAPRSSGAFGSLRRWLLRTRVSRSARVDLEPLDDHTLNDIGMTRFEIVYWTRK